jgi:predicted TIM-barrel fold metal-dependent hydrolase
MRVDAHLHVWRALPADVPSPPTVITGHCNVPIELALAYFNEHGIDRAVLVQPIYPGEDNSYIADTAAAQPDRLAAVCVVDPRVPGAADRLTHWVNERGCKGLRLRPMIPDEAQVFGTPDADPLWESARRHNVVVSVLTGPEHLGTLGVLAERFPEVAIVVDHMAHPDPADGVQSPAFKALLDLVKHARVFIKISGFYHFSAQPYPNEDTWDFVRAVYETFGPRRLLWGSDFPHVLLQTGYRRSLLMAERFFHFIGPDDRNRLMGENAADLYWPEND